MRVARILFCIFVLALFGLAENLYAGAQTNTAVSPTTSADEILITGSLVFKDQSPVIGKTVFLFEAKESGYVIPVSKDGRFCSPCPNSKTDAHGHFTITLNRKIYQWSRFTIIYSSGPRSDGKPMWQELRSNGIPVTVSFDRSTKNIDLVKIFKGPITVEEP
jgi:hypothetical protein